ncbi:thiol reductase thioredoxin [Zobellella denitrificans]|jgi:thioredoxin 2|uniref:thioredoxin TrxC n=1 Tax=Zobellella denitrificans TaxID=347534 RepID=UPI000B8C197F|nr:thioredoxin TrxC [Zobellella denitrificans]OXS16605.1 thiol reductase thioredoxin [Zobellella denitrificans]
MSEHFLICPACGAKNRVPATRLQQEPQCGKCKTALLPAGPLTLDGPRLERLLAHETLPLVVDFWAPWCGPCKMMAPVFEAAAGELQGRLRLAKLDTEAHPQAAARFGIRSIPTLIVFSGGKELARQSGALPAGQLRQWLAQFY